MKSCYRSRFCLYQVFSGERKLLILVNWNQTFPIFGRVSTFFWFTISKIHVSIIERCVNDQGGGTVVSWARWNKCNEKLLLQHILSLSGIKFSGERKLLIFSESEPTFPLFEKVKNFFFSDSPFFKFMFWLLIRMLMIKGGMDEKVMGT